MSARDTSDAADKPHRCALRGETGTRPPPQRDAGAPALRPAAADMTGDRPLTRPARPWLAVAAALAALLVADPAGADTRVSETATNGDVSATLTYVKLKDFGYRDTALTIRRGGAVVFAKPLERCRYCSAWPAYQGRRKSIAVRDLDADGELEVVVETFTGGAHCCLVLTAFRWTGSTYAPKQLDGGSSGYRWADLDGDRTVEWVTADARFEGLFTAYANSYEPIRVVTFREGAFADVTRDYPAQIRKDAREARRLYLRYRGKRDVRGVLAAWAADKVMLGEGADVWPELTRARVRGDLHGDGFTPGDAAYVRKLRATLARFGYTAG